MVLENQALNSHWEIVTSMIKDCEHKVDVSNPQSPVDLNTSRLSQNVNQGVEEVKQRVSKIFTKPTSTKQNPLPNLQAIFKKK